MVRNLGTATKRKARLSSQIYLVYKSIELSSSMYLSEAICNVYGKIIDVSVYYPTFFIIDQNIHKFDTKHKLRRW